MFVIKVHNKKWIPTQAHRTHAVGGVIDDCETVMFNMPLVNIGKLGIKAMASTLPADRMAGVNAQWENVHTVVESQTRADGMHVWPFPPAFPLDIKFFAFDRNSNIRLRRHDYFELVYVFSGSGSYQVQDREFAVGEGDLIVLNGFSITASAKFAVTRFAPSSCISSPVFSVLQIAPAGMLSI